MELVDYVATFVRKGVPTAAKYVAKYVAISAASTVLVTVGFGGFLMVQGTNYIVTGFWAGVDAGVSLPPKRSVIFWVNHELGAEGVAAYNTSLRAVTGSGDQELEDIDEDIVRHNLLIMRQLCVEPALFHKHGRAEFDNTTRNLTVATPGPKLRAALDLIRRLVFEGHSKIVVVSEFVALLDTFKGGSGGGETWGAVS